MKFNKYFDHTNLKPEATRDDIRKLCEEAKTNDFASVCVNGIYTAYAKECLAGSDVKTCVVVGFPLGAMSTDAKAYETRKAVEDGADEIDMVISVGQLKAGSYDEVYEDVKAVREACQGKVLKLIFENCLLTDEEKIKACEIAVRAGVDYVKTSTGFSSGGATISDVALMKAHVDGKCKVKAAGGIRDYNTAIAMIDAGADRLGTSATVKIVNERQ
ncbi:MAG: deoxyribose-phosphate aldolase [Clostridia bacterium]|nr:deoxyribose-phosphate aldolase [Clostridia bacterium]MDY4742942.1 deoxyribose-phosphate aldolase [Lachnospira sp.]